MEANLKEVHRQVPELHQQLLSSKKETNKALKQIEALKAEHVSQLKALREAHRQDLIAKTQQHVQMRKDFDVEYEL